MGAHKGHVKAGGRTKGTPNKKTVAITEAIEASGKDPLKTMLDLLGSSDESIRLTASKELLQYMYPKRKALEVSASGIEDAIKEKSRALDELHEVAKALAEERKQCPKQ